MISRPIRLVAIGRDGTFEGRGFAKAMARALVGIARSARPGALVTAQTAPHLQREAIGGRS